MEYQFNSEIAKLYGVQEAVFLHNLYWWIAKNEANGRHYYDGKSWTYNSMDAFSKLFPFWSVGQIRRIISKLEANGAIHIGNFNQKGFDRTQWYALDETITALYENNNCICRNQQMEVLKSADGCVENDRPIPDSKPYSKPDSKHIYGGFDSFWSSYPRKEAKAEAQKAFKKINATAALLEQILAAIEDQKKSESWVKDGGKYIPHAATWLNGRRWEDEVTPTKPTNITKPGYSSFDLDEIQGLIGGG